MLLKTSYASRALASGRGNRYLIGGCTALLAIICIAVSIEVSTATARPGAVASVQTINRVGKGDRLPLPPAMPESAERVPRKVEAPSTAARRDGLPDGCESLVSSLARSPLALIPRRCLS